MLPQFVTVNCSLEMSVPVRTCPQHFRRKPRCPACSWHTGDCQLEPRSELGSVDRSCLWGCTWLQPVISKVGPQMPKLEVQADRGTQDSRLKKTQDTRVPSLGTGVDGGGQGRAEYDRNTLHLSCGWSMDGIKGTVWAEEGWSSAAENANTRGQKSGQ